jgi:hypothetical protein
LSPFARPDKIPLDSPQIHSSDDGDLPHSFLVVKRTLEPRVDRLGVQIPLTEICAALELSSWEERGPSSCNVFAFLPLRSYGFRFILQADFVVPSSRESIDRNSAWNQRVFEEVRFGRPLRNFSEGSSSNNSSNNSSYSNNQSRMKQRNQQQEKQKQ